MIAVLVCLVFKEDILPVIAERQNILTPVNLFGMVAAYKGETPIHIVIQHGNISGMNLPPNDHLLPPVCK